MMWRGSTGGETSWGPEVRCRVPNHIVSTNDGEATILLDSRAGKYYTLNGVGSCIWARLAEGATVGDTIERIASDFHVPKERATVDVKSFVEQLYRSKLIGR